MYLVIWSFDQNVRYKKWHMERACAWNRSFVSGYSSMAARFSLISRFRWSYKVKYCGFSGPLMQTKKPKIIDSTIGFVSVLELDQRDKTSIMLPQTQSHVTIPLSDGPCRHGHGHDAGAEAARCMGEVALPHPPPLITILTHNLSCKLCDFY